MTSVKICGNVYVLDHSKAAWVFIGLIHQETLNVELKNEPGAHLFQSLHHRRFCYYRKWKKQTYFGSISVQEFFSSDLESR